MRGIVTDIWRYPVKGMRGEPLDEALVTERGIAHDRTWMVSSLEKEDRGLANTRVTARDKGAQRILLYAPAWDGDDLLIRTPGGQQYPIEDPRLAADLSSTLGMPVRLKYDPQGQFDVHPFSVLSHETIAGINERSRDPVDYRQFRPNIYFQCQGAFPAAIEKAFLGGRMRIGNEAEIELIPGLNGKGEPTSGIERCVMITYHPETLAQDVGLMRLVSLDYQNCVGVHAKTIEAGTIRRGDTFRLNY